MDYSFSRFDKLLFGKIRLPFAQPYNDMMNPSFLLPLSCMCARSRIRRCPRRRCSLSPRFPRTVHSKETSGRTCSSPWGRRGPLNPWNTGEGRWGRMHVGRFTSTFPRSTTRNPMREGRTHHENVAFLACRSPKDGREARVRTCAPGRVEAWKRIRTATRPSETPCSRIHCADH